jgi:ribosome-binding protein aMBF1 (putative translation factor)
MQTVLSHARKRAEANERAAVAAAIREAIQRSGLSQAEFASRIGTSPSRLSHLRFRESDSVGHAHAPYLPRNRQVIRAR